MGSTTIFETNLPFERCSFVLVPFSFFSPLSFQSLSSSEAVVMCRTSTPFYFGAVVIVLALLVHRRAALDSSIYSCPPLGFVKGPFE